MNRKFAALAVLASVLLSGRAMALDLTLWHTETEPNRQIVIRYLADLFQAFNPGIQVALRAVDENELLETVAAAAARGQAPDLVSAGSPLVVAMSRRGLVDRTLTDEVVKEIGQERFFAAPLQFLRAEEAGYHGIPFHGWLQAIWYRADWFAEAGLPPPVTVDAVLKAARRFNDPGNMRFGIVIGSRPDLYTEQGFTQFALAMGAELFDVDGEPSFDTPTMREAAETYAELVRLGPPGPQTWRARDFFLQGRAAMMVHSTFIMDDLALEGAAADSLGRENFPQLPGAEFDPDLVRKIAFTTLVTDVRPVGFGVIEALAPLAGGDAARRAATRTLIQFLFRPDAYATWLHMAPGGMLPVLRGVAESDAFMRDPLGVFPRYGRDRVRRLAGGFDRMESFAFDSRTLSEAAEIVAAGIIPKALHRMIHEGVSPDIAMPEAEAQMRRAIGGN